MLDTLVCIRFLQSATLPCMRLNKQVELEVSFTGHSLNLKLASPVILGYTNHYSFVVCYWKLTFAMCYQLIMSKLQASCMLSLPINIYHVHSNHKCIQIQLTCQSKLKKTHIHGDVSYLTLLLYQSYKTLSFIKSLFLSFSVPEVTKSRTCNLRWSQSFFISLIFILTGDIINKTTVYRICLDIGPPPTVLQQISSASGLFIHCVHACVYIRSCVARNDH